MESALKASGGTLFKPGDFPFARCRTASFNSSHPIGPLMPSTVARGSMSEMTSHVTGRSAVYTFSKCGARTEVFSASVEARVPLGKRIRITTGFTWWLSLPPTKTLTAFHACFGVKRMACTCSAKCADQVALAREIVSVTMSCAVESACLSPVLA